MRWWIVKETAIGMNMYDLKKIPNSNKVTHSEK